MIQVVSGDRVQIYCSTSLEDGTELDTKDERKKPYWIRAGAPGKAAASSAVVGMQVGGKKTVTTEPDAGRNFVLNLRVVAIRKPAVA